jgi:hypothetical protein
VNLEGAIGLLATTKPPVLPKKVAAVMAWDFTLPISFAN